MKADEISCNGTMECLTYLLNEVCRIFELNKVDLVKFGLGRQVRRAPLVFRSHSLASVKTTLYALCQVGAPRLSPDAPHKKNFHSFCYKLSPPASNAIWLCSLPLFGTNEDFNMKNTLYKNDFDFSFKRNPLF